MNVIYPLAVPKGRRLCCEVCEAPAERMCTACTVTYYCGPVHQKADWGSIHEKICQLLIPLRTSMPFYNSEEERQHGLQQLQQRQCDHNKMPQAGWSEQQGLIFSTILKAESPSQ
ncbi:zinc finger MYND domain-containing protein 12, partial [Nannospalax galili]|uniref:zinc finger MYND domain-containing protein 12 n=1 Tax=Nannospalax galili TaxID=1026970 RepID=UPI0004ED13D4